MQVSYSANTATTPGITAEFQLAKPIIVILEKMSTMRTHDRIDFVAKEMRNELAEMGGFDPATVTTLDLAEVITTFAEEGLFPIAIRMDKYNGTTKTPFMYNGQNENDEDIRDYNDAFYDAIYDLPVVRAIDTSTPEGVNLMDKLADTIAIQFCYGVEKFFLDNNLLCGAQDTVFIDFQEFNDEIEPEAPMVENNLNPIELELTPSPIEVPAETVESSAVELNESDLTLEKLVDSYSEPETVTTTKEQIVDLLAPEMVEQETPQQAVSVEVETKTAPKTTVSPVELSTEERAILEKNLAAREAEEMRKAFERAAKEAPAGTVMSFGANKQKSAAEKAADLKNANQHKAKNAHKKTVKNNNGHQNKRTDIAASFKDAKNAAAGDKRKNSAPELPLDYVGKTVYLYPRFENVNNLNYALRGIGICRPDRNAMPFTLAFHQGAETADRPFGKMSKTVTVFGKTKKRDLWPTYQHEDGDGNVEMRPYALEVVVGSYSDNKGEKRTCVKSVKNYFRVRKTKMNWIDADSYGLMTNMLKIENTGTRLAIGSIAVGQHGNMTPVLISIDPKAGQTWQEISDDAEICSNL